MNEKPYFCPGPYSDSLKQKYPHQLSIYSFKCRRTNGCSMHHTPHSPDPGDYGFHVLAHIVGTSPLLTQEQNHLRGILVLPSLIRASNQNMANITFVLLSIFLVVIIVMWLLNIFCNSF